MEKQVIRVDSFIFCCIFPKKLEIDRD